MLTIDEITDVEVASDAAMEALALKAKGEVLTEEQEEVLAYSGTLMLASTLVQAGLEVDYVLDYLENADYDLVFSYNGEALEVTANFHNDDEDGDVRV